MSKPEEKPSCSDTQCDEDRISALPDEALHHVLSLMPLKMAMRTSILSTRWRHLWKYTRVVDLGELPFSKEDPVDYTPFSRCLKRLKSTKIQAFCVSGLVGPYSYPNVKKWVDFALSKDVTVLEIALTQRWSDVECFDLPSSLFSEDHTRSLAKLSIGLVDFSLPCDVNFRGFASLKNLSLKGCKLDDRTVELVVAKCCLLESLVLDNCKGLDNVKIIGSNLRLEKLVFRWVSYPDGKMLEVDVPSLLELNYSGSLTRIHLKNSSRLHTAIIIGNGLQTNEASIDHVRKLIHQVVQVRALYVNSWLLEFMELVPCRIVLLTGEEPSFVMVKGGQDQLHHCASLEKLKFIVVLSFSGSEGEMMLVKLLLEKAVNLRKLKLLWQEQPCVLGGQGHKVYTSHMGGNLNPDSQRALIEETVSRFPKASPIAQLQFIHGDSLFDS